MTLPILTVVSALGTQGASVISVLTSENSRSEPKYHIRALTSNASSPAAKSLASRPNVSVVAVDLTSLESIEAAFEGSVFIFANTYFSPQVFMKEGPDAAQRLEGQQGLNIARAASRVPSLKHFIWSSIKDDASMSGGKYRIPHIQSKQPAEKFIKSPESGLASKTSFLYVGIYGANISRDPYRPLYVEAAKKHVLVIPCRPDTPLPFIGDESVNVGLIVKATLAQPAKTLGRAVSGSPEKLSCRELAAAYTKALKSQGKDVETVFMQCKLDEFGEIWGPLGLETGSMFEYFDEYGVESAEDGSQVTAKDLGIEKELRTTQQRLSDMEWPLHTVSFVSGPVQN